MTGSRDQMEFRVWMADPGPQVLKSVRYPGSGALPPYRSGRGIYTDPTHACSRHQAEHFRGSTRFRGEW